MLQKLSQLAGTPCRTLQIYKIHLSQQSTTYNIFKM
jgi:hypothetical protein